VGLRRAIVLAALVLGCGREEARAPAGAAPAPPHQTIRVAVIGGMIETGFWPELAERFERASGHTIELAASGPKPRVIDAFRKGGIHLLTTHACDAIVNVAADGLAVDPQPWVRNDLVIVGPAGDPAGIRGQRDAVAAVRALIDAKAKVLVHASMGADEVLHDLLEAGRMQLDPSMAVLAAGDNATMLAQAAEAGAYTLVGRIPFASKKLPSAGMELMVQGDPRLRRPYLVVVAAGPAGDPQLQAAREHAAWLRSAETQQWSAGFGRGRWDPEPIFFPLVPPGVQPAARAGAR
jgi:tungstate transport system substrate-binding protein